MLGNAGGGELLEYGHGGGGGEHGGCACVGGGGEA